jgi:hypothetical protein
MTFCDLRKWIKVARTCNGTGGFTQFANSPFPVGNGPSSIAVGDFNDTFLDLAITNELDQCRRPAAAGLIGAIFTIRAGLELADAGPYPAGRTPNGSALDACGQRGNARTVGFSVAKAR